MLTEIRPYLRPEAIIISLTNWIALSVPGTLVDSPIVKVIPTIAEAVGSRSCGGRIYTGKHYRVDCGAWWDD